MFLKHSFFKFAAGSALLGFVLAGCNSSSTMPNATGNSATTADAKTVNFLQIATNTTLDDTRKGFLRGLKEKGFEEGKNLNFTYKSAEGDVATAQLIARDFAGQNPDVLASTSSPALQSVMKATKEVPIVFCGVADPASAGAITSGKQKENVTGVSNPDPVDKTLALVKEMMPNVKTVGTLYDPSEPFTPLFRERSQKAAKELGLEWVEVSVNSTNDLTTGVQALKARGVEAIMQIPSNVADAGIKAIVKASNEARIPFFSTHPTHIPAGALACLGWDYEQAGYDAGVVAARILNGEKPAAIPIESVKKEDLVINLPVATKFGVTVPQELQKRAQRVVK